MKCSEFEQWISDLADGELPEAKRILLEKHLLDCPSCRAHKENTDALHEEVIHLDQASPGPEYFHAFSERLRANLASEKPPRHPRVFVELGWRWTYAAAAAAFVAVMMVFLISPQHRFFQDDGAVVILYEDAISVINGSIGDDVELEELFNTLLLASIAKEVEDPDWREGVGYSEEDNLFKGFTEEEKQLLNTIEKKMQ